MRKVAIITGGAIRVGRAVALHLAQRGYDLLVTYLTSEAPARSLAAKCATFNAKCELLRCDLRNPDAAETISRKHHNIFPGQLHLLLHNASLFPAAKLEDSTSELMATLMQVHVITPQLLTARLAAPLRASSGCVIAMADGVEGKGYLRYPAYAASKAALLSLTRSWALALAPHARANAIAPGAVLWPQDTPDTEKARFLERVPLARGGNPQDIANAVWFLAEEAPYTTGSVLHVDGGLR